MVKVNGVLWYEYVVRRDIGVARGMGHGDHGPQSILDKNKDLGRAGAKGSQGVWSPSRHAWPPNQKAYSLENSGLCA